MTTDADPGEGERGLPWVRQTVPWHTRLGNLLALGLMLAMGAGVLSLYYLHTIRHQAQLHARAGTRSGEHAAAETSLPELGALTPPSVLTRSEPTAESAGTRAAPDMPLAPASPASVSSVTGTAGTANRISSLDRKLSGAAFTPSATSYSATSAGSQPAAAAGPDAGAAASSSLAASGAGALAAAAGGSVAGGADPAGSMLTPWLRPSPVATASARVLPTQRLLLPKGAFIDCTLETAIDSTLPGMTTCITATDTFGVDGLVVLLERGTKLIGETRGQVQQGTARVFVLWNEARTPTGVIVPLDSPAADQLGRSGLPGSVDRHFWDRLGAALLVSTIDGAVQAAVQSTNRGGGTVIYNPTAAQEVTTEVLKSTLSIPPTVRKQNGDRIQVLVARDIDFTRVYELRRAGSIE